jgi:hypothetical protein
LTTCTLENSMRTTAWNSTVCEARCTGKRSNGFRRRPEARSGRKVRPPRPGFFQGSPEASAEGLPAAHPCPVLAQTLGGRFPRSRLSPPRTP